VADVMVVDASDPDPDPDPDPFASDDEVAPDVEEALRWSAAAPPTGNGP